MVMSYDHVYPHTITVVDTPFYMSFHSVESSSYVVTFVDEPAWE